MAGSSAGRSGSGRSGGGTVAKPASALSRKQIKQGVKTTYKASGVLTNTHQNGVLDRFTWGDRIAKAERMAGRVSARREALFSARRQLERNDKANNYRALRKKDPKMARQLFALSRR